MQTIARHSTSPSARDRAPSRVRHLEDLVRLEHDDLTPLYEGAALPRLDRIAGDLRGRMLAVPALPRAITRLPRAWARSGAFPWRGKSFAPKGEARGEGVNRVVFDRVRLFRFETFTGPSRHDGAPAIQLDYDHAGNPGFIRRIEDEIREVAPGLYLGQAWLRLSPASKKFVLWFALEER
jgi:hypothetical protein